MTFGKPPHYKVSAYVPMAWAEVARTPFASLRVCNFIRLRT